MTTDYSKMTRQELAKKTIETMRNDEYSEDVFQAFFDKLLAHADEYDEYEWAKLGTNPSRYDNDYFTFYRDKYDDLYLVDHTFYMSSLSEQYVDLQAHIEHVRNDYANGVELVDDEDYLKIPVTEDEGFPFVKSPQDIQDEEDGIEYDDDDKWSYSFEDFIEESNMVNSIVFRVMLWCAEHPGKFVVCGYSD